MERKQNTDVGLKQYVTMTKKVTFRVTQDNQKMTLSSDNLEKSIVIICFNETNTGNKNLHTEYQRYKEYKYI